MIDTKALYGELRIGWGEGDQLQLLDQLRSHTDALQHYLDSGQPIPSHIKNASSVCVPITEVTDPAQLFEDAGGDVGAESYVAEEYEDYWITVHHSDVPVVILLLKHAPRKSLDALERLMRSSADALDSTINNPYLQYNMPGFGWQLHTDDDYEGVSRRVHLPLVTSPENIFAWASTLDTKPDDWLLSVHLEPGKVYETRVDVPHTAINNHPTEGRLHLILDVGAGEIGARPEVQAATSAIAPSV